MVSVEPTVVSPEMETTPCNAFSLNLKPSLSISVPPLDALSISAALILRSSLDTLRRSSLLPDEKSIPLAGAESLPPVRLKGASSADVEREIDRVAHRICGVGIHHDGIAGVHDGQTGRCHDRSVGHHGARESWSAR